MKAAWGTFKQNLSVAASGVKHPGNTNLDATGIIGQLNCWVVWTPVLVTGYTNVGKLPSQKGLEICTLYRSEHGNL